jgi:hypothetical protein
MYTLKMKHTAKMKQSGETFHNRPGEINVIFIRSTIAIIIEDEDDVVN